MGKTPARNNDTYWNTKDYKWISIADLTSSDKYINDTKEHISKLAVLESGIKLIPANTVVMSFKLSIGKTAILYEDMYSNEAIMAFHDKHIVELLPEYIYYLIKAPSLKDGYTRCVLPLREVGTWFLYDSVQPAYSISMYNSYIKLKQSFKSQ